jgi:lipopolysaccharide/colanic/teichoic acid biosynthesis glycosyltransferase
MRPSKRFFDLALTGLGLLVLWPGLLLIGLIVKLSDGGPMFFRQQRVGRLGKPFRMWKFRTMKVDARGEPITLHEDPRVTNVGRVLRAFRLDELPQLFNVVAGDMSLVGPRPDVPKYVARYTDQQRRVLELTPGITDPAVFTVRNYRKQHADAKDLEQVYINEIMSEKVRISIEYGTRATLLTDLQVIMKTLRAVFR